jgi:hypothetical protein
MNAIFPCGNAQLARHIEPPRRVPRRVASVLQLGLPLAVLLGGCDGGASSSPASSTGPSLLRTHDGSRLRLAEPVTVEAGDVSTPAMTTDPRSGRVYLAWTRQSATAGPFGGHLGTSALAGTTDTGHTFSPAVMVQPVADVQAPQVLAVTPRGTLLDAWASFKPNPSTPFGEFSYRLGRSTDQGATFAVSGVTDGGIQSVSRPNLMVDEQGQAWASWARRQAGGQDEHGPSVQRRPGDVPRRRCLLHAGLGGQGQRLQLLPAIDVQHARPQGHLRDDLA